MAESIITRGTYNHSQINGFVTAREYMFLNKDGQKCVIIRFYNESKHTLNSLEFTFTQLASDGRELGKTTVRYTNISFKPGGKYSTETAIMVSPSCSDFEIQIKSASSAYYLFRIRRDNVIAYYDRRSRADYRAVRHRGSGHAEVRTIRPGGYLTRSIMTFLATVAVVGVVVLSLFFDPEGFLNLPF